MRILPCSHRVMRIVRRDSVQQLNGLVRHVVDEELTPGIHSVRWDGRDRSGQRVAAGVYFAKLRTSRGRTDSIKMIALR